MEETAENQMAYCDIDILKGFRSYDARNLARKLQLKGKELLSIANILVKLYGIYRKYDCKLVEVNPLIMTDKGAMALDSKIEIDDDAIYRHRDLNITPGDEVGDREPTLLEDAAGGIDHNDHRGSAHFVQIDQI